MAGVRLWLNASEWHVEQRLVGDPISGFVQILDEHGHRHTTVIGIVGLGSDMPVTEFHGLQAAVDPSRLVDATSLFDRVRVLKSTEELEGLRETGHVVDAALQAAAAVLQQGMTEREVIAEHYAALRRMGSYDGWVNVRRPPFQTSGPPTDRPFERGDLVTIYTEQMGPSGYWVEAQRCFSLGRPTRDALEFWASRADAYRACQEVMRPGASSREVHSVMVRHYDRSGLDVRSIRAQIAHGIGLDASERPFMPEDEFELQAGMAFALHPYIYFDPGPVAVRFGGLNVTDTVIVGTDGPEAVAGAQTDLVVLG
jgi:Xaa-Pro aminopeptidase